MLFNRYIICYRRHYNFSGQLTTFSICCGPKFSFTSDQPRGPTHGSAYAFDPAAEILVPEFALFRCGAVFERVRWRGILGAPTESCACRDHHLAYNANRRCDWVDGCHHRQRFRTEFRGTVESEQPDHNICKFHQLADCAYNRGSCFGRNGADHRSQSCSRRRCVRSGDAHDK
jgi:hypothetical protein